MPVSPKKLRAKKDGTASIKRTDAAKKYKLKPADLDTLLPVRVEQNMYGGVTTRYNTGDVERLAEQLKSDPSSSAARSLPSCTVKKRGGTILKTQAMTQFDLTAEQMATIKPRQIKPNPHDPDLHMYIYNLVDVEDLHGQVRPQKSG